MTSVSDTVRKQETQKNEETSRRRNVSRFTALILSLLSVIALMAGLVAATFAWFTDTAVTKGSSVVTGYMGADLYFDEATIEEYAKKYVTKTLDPVEVEKLGLTTLEVDKWTEGDWEKVIQKFKTDKEIDEEKDKYVRRILKTGEETPTEETYYRITDKELNVITLDNVEPGQAYPVEFYVANTGQLAFTFSSGFHIEKSLTGWMRFYAEKEAGKISETDEKYKVIEKILIEEQTEKDPEMGEPKKDSTGKYIDKGGHLEDVLEVYLVPDDFYKDNPDRKIREAIVKDNYIGTMAEIIGKPAKGDAGNEGGAGNDGGAGNGGGAGNDGGAGKEGMLKAGNRAFTGYLLPKSAVTQKIAEQDVIVPTDVEIRNGEILIEKKTGVTELGKLSFLIVAPETMEDEYQYASISISLGAFTTQVEYEKDGTDCMIYDEGAHVIEGAMTATASTTTPQQAGQQFKTDGLTIKVLKGEAEYDTATLPDPSIAITKVSVNGEEDGILVPGENSVEIEFTYYDRDSLTGHSLTTDVFTVDGLLYSDVDGLDAALADIDAAKKAMLGENYVEGHPDTVSPTIFNVPLKLNEMISGKPGGTTYDWPIQIYDVDDDPDSDTYGTVAFGPALEKESILYDNIASTYRKWNPKYSGATGTDPAANYATSHIRATLNGTDVNETYAGTDNLTSANCLLSCFPDSLKNNPNGSTYGIVAREMTVPTQWDISSPYTINDRATIKDKLWLFSANELYGGLATDYPCAEEGGTQMQLPAGLEVTHSSYDKLICNDDRGGYADRWLRSPNRGLVMDATCVDSESEGILSYGDVDGAGKGLAPGFCLKVLN